jgi:predicted MFS family arabinose efflux permease
VFVIIGQRLGLGAAGYGYLLAAMGAGGVLAAGISNKAATSKNPRRALIASMLAVGAPLPLLAVTGWIPAALLLAGVFGAGSVTAEVVGDTCMQRTLTRRSSPAPTASPSRRSSAGSPPAHSSLLWPSRWSGLPPPSS